MPPRSKKSEKPRRSPVQRNLATDGADTATAAGANNGGGSRAVFRDESEDRRLHALGTSTPTHGREDDVTLLRERGHDHISKDAHDTVQSMGSGVIERDTKDAALRVAAIPVDTSQRPAWGFGPLKAVLGTISAVYTDHQKATAVGSKIADLLSRVEAPEARFAAIPGNVVEQRPRSELIRKFGDIEGQLRSLSQKSILQRLADHVQDEEEVSGLTEDTQEIIFDYQMAQQMAMYKQACKLISPADASVLNNFRCAQGAEYCHGDRRTCLKGTRTAVLDEIELWTRDFDKPPIYWLNGLAGTGKGTIAQTIAGRVFADGQLGASFFCSQDFQDRRSLHLIFPTLAVQLARRYPEYRSIFVPLVQSNPELVNGSLYTQIISLIVRPLKESGISTVIVIDALDECKVDSVLAAVILAADPLSPSTIATLLGFGAKDVLLRLSSVHPLLIPQDNVDSPTRPFHKSFPNFIVDPTRCIDQRFHISPRNHHMELLVGCLNLMNQTLEKNMCKLPDATPNSKVPDLRQRIKRYIGSALQYACKSWHKHLVDEHMARTPNITSALHQLLENKFVFWLEVLSVLGAAREAIDALNLVTRWLEVSATRELANDCSRFATKFMGIIDESAPHIYHSALPVSPQTSMVRKLYERHAHPLTRIVHGLPVSWDPGAVTMEYSSESAAWSPCGRFIAISNDDYRTDIVDATTLKRLATFESGKTRKLVFSPDARLLVCFHSHSAAFTSWDVRTGTQVSTMSVEDLWGIGAYCLSMTYSPCGMIFGALFRIRLPDDFTICTYNVHSGTHIYTHPVKGKVIGNIWTHGERLRFATVNSGSITVWEVGFASRNTPTEIESLPLPDNLPHDSHPHSFHPTLCRLAITHSNSGGVLVWDARHSKILLDEKCNWGCYGFSFSPDGRFFMHEERWQIYLWKESPTGYILHRKLSCEIEVPELFISPNGESILVCDEMLAAVTEFKDKTITVLDLESGDPLSIIDTGTEIYGQRMTGSTVVAVGHELMKIEHSRSYLLTETLLSFHHENIITWNLPTGNRVLNPKANVIRTAKFSCPGMFSYSLALRFASISLDLHRIAITVGPMFGYPPACTYRTASWIRFTSDGRQVCYITDRGEANGLAVAEDRKSGVIELEHLKPTRQPPNMPPQSSSRGYQVVDNRWILDFSGKRLLWLPPHWQSLGANRTWSGRFLALLHGTLPEAVILELEE
ncbi:hypothetical protein BDM02DRAFT_3262329 [Thelephora ganbajun]|uniref:Uncharacterized protein n=1 Tax=Thelephora ganbajun TaxID=370292 RepID=A0ACB6Z9N8_THEGA|nr:hypothetical protein BDM02DRAFT_3262329 [Thelephora ganbajun]